MTALAILAQGSSNSASSRSSSSIQMDGLSRYVSGDIVGAIQALDEALVCDPSSARSWAVRGAAKFRLGRLDDATRDCDEALTREQDNAFALATRGAVRFEKGDIDGAIQDSTRATTSDPAWAFAWSTLASARFQSCDFTGTIAASTEALRLDPAKFQRGDFAGALADYDQAMSSAGKDLPASAWRNRGKAHSRLGNMEDAAADFSKAISLEPRLAESWYSRAMVRLEMGDLLGVVEDSTEALTINPQCGEAHAALGVALLEEKCEHARALVHLDSAINNGLLLAAVLSDRGAARLAGGDVDGATSDFEEALRLEPQLVLAKVGCGAVEFSKGNSREALALFAEAIRA
eukprot:CAMPEP_0169308194 /NCGR_PEP_ID=MMETSP1017-20121227/1715_1 /TAXON_ID=342587 /ORGANISM="Karlodinium micrum, Strain CCMP2283" /LENGTH=347 /DNA_ID=CAMNT_0009401571 /DNA_START=12 /DNA_END=1052 /DNA_ORIENTATION=+